MKRKIYIPFIIFALVVIAAVMTCPDRQDHKDAIMAVINERISEEIQQSSSDGNGALAALGASIGTSVSEWILDKGLFVDNYFVCSIGKFNTGKEYKRVSVGVFGHVFTFSKDDVDEVLKELAN